MKILVVLMIIVSLGLGYLLGLKRSLLPYQDLMVSVSPVGTENYKAKYLKLIARFQKLRDVDFEEYTRLRGAQKKYQKADEILGKMMVIFLADLGLRMTPKQIQAFKGTKSSALSSKLQDMKEPPKSSSDSENRAHRESPNTSGSPEEVSSAEDWRAKEKKLKQLDSETGIESFLDSVVVLNLFEEIGRAAPFGEKELKILNGYYTGTLNHLNPEEEPWTIEIDVDGVFTQGKVSGKFAVRMSKNGEVFSNSTGEGQPKGLKSFSGKSRALLIETLGGRGFFQLYPFQGDELIGNFYKKIKPGQYKKAGTLRLGRR